MAQESLQKVDATRRYEFLRRKDDKDVEEKAETDNRILQIRRNFGWPFSQGLISDGDLQEDYERGWEGVPCCSFCGASHIQVWFSYRHTVHHKESLWLSDFYCLRY